MKFTFKDKEYEFHYSQRIHMMFERIQGYSIDFNNLTNEDHNVLAYVCFLATLQYNKVYEAVDYIDFLNWVDDNGNSKFMLDFSAWFITAMEHEYDLIKSDIKEEDLKKIESEIEKKA